MLPKPTATQNRSRAPLKTRFRHTAHAHYVLAPVWQTPVTNSHIRSTQGNFSGGRKARNLVRCERADYTHCVDGDGRLGALSRRQTTEYVSYTALTQGTKELWMDVLCAYKQWMFYVHIYAPRNSTTDNGSFTGRFCSIRLPPLRSGIMRRRLEVINWSVNNMDSEKYR